MVEAVHVPVLLEEVLEAMDPRPGEVYLDGTIGEGSAARALLARAGKDARLLGMDRDPDQAEIARRHLAPYGDRVRVIAGSFEEIHEAVQTVGWGFFRGALLDLGLSSRQLAGVQHRGFSFEEEQSPLDMRLDPSAGPTAASILQRASERELVRIFREGGEVRHARRLARAIVRERRSIRTTGDLRRLIERCLRVRGRRRLHPATLAYQSIRYEVNDERGTLERGLPRVFAHLEEGGRLAVIAFESITDRIVKRFCQDRVRAGEAAWIARKPVRPAPRELRENPRSRSARLRVIEKKRSVGVREKP